MCEFYVCGWKSLTRLVYLLLSFGQPRFFSEVYAECPACIVVSDVINSATHLPGFLSLELMLSATVIQVHSNEVDMKLPPRNSIYTGSEEFCWSTIVWDVRSLLLLDFYFLSTCSPIERFAEEHRCFQGLICLHVICNFHLVMPGKSVWAYVSFTTSKASSSSLALQYRCRFWKNSNWSLHPGLSLSQKA